MFNPQPIHEVIRIKPRRFDDARGDFTETFWQSLHESNGTSGLFVEDDRSMSRGTKVVRGLHFDFAPSAQEKLVRCARYHIRDFALAIHSISPAYGQCVTARIFGEDGHQIFVSPGPAHSCCALTRECELEYNVTVYCIPEAERGKFWNDPLLGIGWPLPKSSHLVSERDANLPCLYEIVS